MVVMGRPRFLRLWSSPYPRQSKVCPQRDGFVAFAPLLDGRRHFVGWAMPTLHVFARLRRRAVEPPAPDHHLLDLHSEENHRRECQA